jgi:hypothetical protein
MISANQTTRVAISTLASKRSKIGGGIMATADLTSSLRAFAFKTLEEAKQRGATLATVQAATASLADVTAASLSRLSGNVPASSALGVFRAQQAEQQSQPQPTLSGGHDAVTALGLKLQQLGASLGG